MVFENYINRKTAYSSIIIGIILLASSYIWKSQEFWLNSFGIALTCIGLGMLFGLHALNLK